MTARRSFRSTSTRPHVGRVWSVLVGTVRVVGRVLCGLIAAAALLALVVGLPWALGHFIGWPLPDHIPTWNEVQGVLLGPMTDTFLLGALACLTWVVWFFFTVDVIRCTVNLARDGIDAVRLPNVGIASPVHALAGILISAVLLSVLGNRLTPTLAASPVNALGADTGVVATAPAWPGQSDGSQESPVEDTVFVAHTAPASTANPRTTNAAPTSVVVRAPENGVHDTLSRIALRTLGDDARWPEIYQLNKGQPQPYGHTFTNPNLIFPGQELALPADGTIPAPPPLDPSPPEQSPESSSPEPTTTPPPSDQSSAPSMPRAPTTDSRHAAAREPGVRWGTELFVGFGLAAAVSTALVVARRRRNNRYRPGSGDRTKLPVAPVVYQLRLAHLRTEADELDLVDLEKENPGRDRDDGHSVAVARQRPVSPPPAVVGATETSTSATGRAAVAPIGVQDGREVALDLATARGLGLIGAGAAAATRALVITALTMHDGRPPDVPLAAGTVVVIPASDLTGLLGHATAPADVPAALRVVANLDEALEVTEAEILVRAASAEHNAAAARSWPALVLVARPAERQRQRLQAVLDNGAPFGVTGLMMGQWQPGITAYVRADGTISATSPGSGERLRGTRVFRMGDTDIAELLTLQRHADPIPRGAQPEGDGPPPVAVRLDPADPAAETEWDVTTAVDTPQPHRIGLEILNSLNAPTPGVRLRPPTRPGSTTPRSADFAAPENRDNGDGESNSRVHDKSASIAEHPASTATPATTTAGATNLEGVRARIAISVLGPFQVQWNPEPGMSQPSREITSVLQPRTRELLVLLALHPDGITRAGLVSALWGDDPPNRPTNALHTALTRLRTTISSATNQAVPDIAVAHNGRYDLDPDTVEVDYWRFAHAVAARRTASTDQDRVNAYRDVIDAYGGPLAEGMTSEWIEPAREAIRRDAIDAVAALARALVDTDPQQTLDLLEIARAFDPHNEPLYRDIMRLQARIGQHDAVPRTLALLTTRLAEIGETPTPQARDLAARLGQSHDTPATTTDAVPTRLARKDSRRPAAS